MTKKCSSNNGVLILMHDIPSGIELDFNRWYPEEHFLERLSIDGMQSVRRYHAVDSQPKYMVIYKAENIENFISERCLSILNNPTERTKKLLKCFENVTRAASRETWKSSDSAIGGKMLTIQCKPIEGAEQRAREYVQGEFFKKIFSTGALLSLSLCESDRVITEQSNSDMIRRALPDYYSDWFLLAEGYDLSALSLALHKEVMQSDSRHSGLLFGTVIRYELMCGVVA